MPAFDLALKVFLAIIVGQLTSATIFVPAEFLIWKLNYGDTAGMAVVVSFHCISVITATFLYLGQIWSVYEATRNELNFRIRDIVVKVLKEERERKF